MRPSAESKADDDIRLELVCQEVPQRREEAWMHERRSTEAEMRRWTLEYCIERRGRKREEECRGWGAAGLKVRGVKLECGSCDGDERFVVENWDSRLAMGRLGFGVDEEIVRGEIQRLEQLLELEEDSTLAMHAK